MNEEVRMVFDVDDTICYNHKRNGYENNIPDLDMINKINYLHDELGFYIILHTSRGMISCNGNEKEIILKNKNILEDWLRKNKVHYDELIFCKPIADLYIDDKGMSKNDFIKESFDKISLGGSGKYVYRLGNVIKKKLGDDVKNYKDWIEDNKGCCKTPKVQSYLYDSVYIEYIIGKRLNDELKFEDLLDITNTIYKFSETKIEEFNLEVQIDILKKNKSENCVVNNMIDDCIKYLYKFEDVIKENSSFSHGDMILSNMIKNEDNEIIFIDPRYFRDSSSYLLDLAKLRMSLSGYDFDDVQKFRNYLDYTLNIKNIYDVVIVLQLMFTLRLYRYKDCEGKVKVISMILKLEEENEKLFERLKEN